MTNDVAIIGVGLHPFGRFEGKSAMEMGVDAIFAAVADAGIEWKDIQFATGGSWTVANPDVIVGMVGLSGIPFTNVFNACATAAYLHDHGVSQETLAKVAAKNFRNGALNPNAFRRKPIPEEEILNSAMLNYPLTQYMFCAPDEGAAAVVMCRADIAHRYTSKPVYLRAVEVRTRRYGAYRSTPPSPPLRRMSRRRYTQPRRHSKRQASHRRTSTSSSSRTPTPARRSSTWPSAGSAPTASRKS